MVPLSLAVAALIVVLPLTRLGAILYALAPMAIWRHPIRRAAQRSRDTQSLQRVWAWWMAGIIMKLHRESIAAIVTKDALARRYGRQS